MMTTKRRKKKKKNEDVYRAVRVFFHGFVNVGGHARDQIHSLTEGLKVGVCFFRIL